MKNSNNEELPNFKFLIHNNNIYRNVFGQENAHALIIMLNT
jgi:hypothetical protein